MPPLPVILVYNRGKGAPESFCHAAKYGGRGKPVVSLREPRNVKEKHRVQRSGRVHNVRKERGRQAIQRCQHQSRLPVSFDLVLNEGHSLPSIAKFLLLSCV